MTAGAESRSPQSLEFEAFWRAMPRTGLTPMRKDFRPERVRGMLPYISMIEVRLRDAQPSLPIRLMAGVIQYKAQDFLGGCDCRDLFPPEYHAGMIESARLIVGRPCGLWQKSAFHYQRGFAMNWEITIFPLLSEEGQPPLMLLHALPQNDLVQPVSTGAQIMRVETASVFHFIDVGAGVPQWKTAA